MTSSAYFDPVQRYNPFMINVLLCLFYVIGAFLKLGGVTQFSWTTMGYCALSSLIMMSSVSWLFKQGREVWPRWDKQFAHIPAISVGLQILLFWSIAPEVADAVALVWFAVHSIVIGRLSVLTLFIYSSILMLGFYQAVFPHWTSHPDHQIADLTFMIAFIVVNIYLGFFSRYEAKRDLINLTNQQRLIDSQTTLAKANAELERLSNHDPLTDLYNRRGFNKHTYPRPNHLCILMVDIDDFKLYNDFFGHPAGDQCIRTVAEVLRRCVNKHAVIARYGGEEFVIALFDVHQDHAMHIAELIRQAIERQALPHPAARAANVVTVSIGVAHSGINTEPIDIVVKLADIALYEAKQAGRNCCHLFQPQIHTHYSSPVISTESLLPR